MSQQTNQKQVNYSPSQSLRVWMNKYSHPLHQETWIYMC